MVTETSYQILDVLSFCDRETYRDKDNIANFSGKKKSTMRLFRVSLFGEYAKNFKLNLVKSRLSRE